jgi:hypothetical protein
MQVTQANKAGGILALERSRGTAVSTVDLQGCFASHEVSSGPDVLGGHLARVSDAERFVNISD